MSEEKLYALIWKDTGKIITPKDIKDFYNSDPSIPRWRRSYRYSGPSKKVYQTLGYAKSGLKKLNEELRIKVSIGEFSFSKIIKLE